MTYPAAPENQMSPDEVRMRFRAPLGEIEYEGLHDQFREGFEDLAIDCAGGLEQSRELSMALTHLEEAWLWVQSAIRKDKVL